MLYYYFQVNAICNFLNYMTYSSGPFFQPLRFPSLSKSSITKVSVSENVRETFATGAFITLLSGGCTKFLNVSYICQPFRFPRENITLAISTLWSTTALPIFIIGPNNPA